VAVCTNRRPAQVAECLAALAEQVGSQAVVVVTSGLAPAEVSEHRAAHLGPLLEEAREGLSIARNRALAWCRPGDVVAFVDDDAVIAPNWWHSLRRRWSEAPARVACIGGPIRPRFAVKPPSWLSPALLPGLTALDLGPEVQDLDPSHTTVYGANISFRVEPLRAVGGFDPDFGHSGRRVYFSEEDEAQRALAAAGHTVRYAPDPAVWHVIPADRLTRGSFLRRRYAYGIALGRRGGRARRVALRQVVSSGSGAVVAAVRRRDALLMERAVRVAENLGVLRGLGP
jgi:glycosyltransferase involved in cell wall biosynthesis